jgi:hypothetical protein
MELFIYQNLSGGLFTVQNTRICVIGTGGFLGDTMSATLPLPIFAPMLNNNVEGLTVLEHLHHWAQGWLMNWWCDNTLIGFQSIHRFTFYLVTNFEEDKLARFGLHPKRNHHTAGARQTESHPTNKYIVTMH